MVKFCSQDVEYRNRYNLVILDIERISKADWQVILLRLKNEGFLVDVSTMVQIILFTKRFNMIKAIWIFELVGGQSCV